MQVAAPSVNVPRAVVAKSSQGCDWLLLVILCADAGLYCWEGNFCSDLFWGTLWECAPLNCLHCFSSLLDLSFQVAF